MDALERLPFACRPERRSTPTRRPAAQRPGGTDTGPELFVSFLCNSSTFIWVFKQTETKACMVTFCLCTTKLSTRYLCRGLVLFFFLFFSVTSGRLFDVIQFCTVTRVSHHELLNQCFVVIHNFLSIIHANVCVVYLIVLLTIKSNFLKVLKDTKFNQHNYFSDAMLLSILNLLNSSLIYVPFWRKYEFNQTIRLKS